MRIQNEKESTHWYSAIVRMESRAIPGSSDRVELKPVYGYRLSFFATGCTPDERLYAQKKWENRGVKGELKVMDHSEEGLPKGEYFLEVSDPKSIANLEAYFSSAYKMDLDVNRFTELAGKSFPVLSTPTKDISNKIEEHTALYYKVQQDWDEILLQNGKRALRINLDRMAEEDVHKMIDRLRALGIDEKYLKPRIATANSGHVKAGDRTIRIQGAANLERMTVLFNHAQRPNEKWEWRNLNNWHTQNVMTPDGKKHPRLLFNLENLTEVQRQHMLSVLDDLSVVYEGHKKTEGFPFEHLTVTGKESVEALKEFTKHWTRSTNGRNFSRGE